MKPSRSSARQRCVGHFIKQRRLFLHLDARQTEAGWSRHGRGKATAAVSVSSHSPREKRWKKDHKEENVRLCSLSSTCVKSPLSAEPPLPQTYPILWGFFFIVVSEQTWLTCDAHPALVPVSSPPLTSARVPQNKPPVCSSTASSGVRTSATATAEGRPSSFQTPFSYFAKWSRSKSYMDPVTLLMKYTLPAMYRHRHDLFN